MHPLISESKAIIFDMDGLLINSEPYWKIAEKKVFRKLGLTLTDTLLQQVMGFRLSEVVTHWYQYQPWQNPNFEQTENEILECVEILIQEHAEAMPGVYELLAFLAAQNIPMALASSSAMSLINMVIDKLAINRYFDVVCSAEIEPYGKPHPGIFLTAAKKLNAIPSNCLVIEDSINGVIAAKAARMKCVAVPELASASDKRFAIADLQLASLENLLW